MGLLVIFLFLWGSCFRVRALGSALGFRSNILVQYFDYPEEISCGPTGVVVRIRNDSFQGMSIRLSIVDNYGIPRDLQSLPSSCKYTTIPQVDGSLLFSTPYDGCYVHLVNTTVSLELRIDGIDESKRIIVIERIPVNCTLPSLAQVTVASWTMAGPTVGYLPLDQKPVNATPATIPADRKPVNATPATIPADWKPVNATPATIPVGPTPATIPADRKPVNATPATIPADRKPVNATPEIIPVGPTPATIPADRKPVNATPATIPADRKPVNATPATIPADRKPVNATPATIPADRKPVNATPATIPADRKPVNATPATIPADRKPVNATPATIPADRKPVNATPATIPADRKPVNATPATIPADRKPVNATPATIPADRKPVNATPATIPADRKPVNATPATIPADRKPVNATPATIPADRKPVNATPATIPADRKPVNATPATIPADRKPVNATPATIPVGPTPATIPADRKPVNATPATIPADRKPVNATPATIPADRKPVNVTPATIPADWKPVNATPATIPADRKPVNATPATIPVGPTLATIPADRKPVNATPATIPADRKPVNATLATIPADRKPVNATPATIPVGPTPATIPADRKPVNATPEIIPVGPTPATIPADRKPVNATIPADQKPINATPATIPADWKPVNATRRTTPVGQKLNGDKVQICDVGAKDYIQCGNVTLGELACGARGCCYDPINVQTPCFYGKTAYIDCSSNGLFTIVVPRIATVPALNLGSVSLVNNGSSECVPVARTAEIVVFSFPFNSCGTTQTIDGVNITYEVDLIAKRKIQKGPRGSITRESTFRLHVTCHLTGKRNIPLTLVVNTPSPLPFIVQDGVLQMEMRIAKDGLYTTWFADEDYPIVKFLREPVYVEVRLLHRMDANIALLLNDCWATQTLDPHHGTRWSILVQGCPFNGDNYLTQLHAVTATTSLQFPTHHKWFEVKTFTFWSRKIEVTLTGEVYFHCSASVCFLSEKEKCVMACDPAKRIARSSDGHNPNEGLVTLKRPIIFTLAEGKSVAEPSQANGNLSSGILLAATVISLALALITGLVLCWNCKQMHKS